MTLLKLMGEYESHVRWIIIAITATTTLAATTLGTIRISNSTSNHIKKKKMKKKKKPIKMIYKIISRNIISNRNNFFAMFQRKKGNHKAKYTRQKSVLKFIVSHSHICWSTFFFYKERKRKLFSYIFFCCLVFSWCVLYFHIWYDCACYLRYFTLYFGSNKYKI